MRRIMTLVFSISFCIGVFLFALVAKTYSVSDQSPFFQWQPVVHAYEEDDDEDEDEEEDEDDEDDEEEDESPSSAKKSSQTETVTKQVVTYETRIVNDPEFLIDSDRDGLVDGVDPEPNFDFREYFTDIDGDGVPNAFDKHHDEDDFSYHDEEVDENNNGILDSYE